MSLRSYGVRKTLAAAGVSALAAMAAVAPAQAATLQQTYECTYPLIGQRALTVDIDAAIPAEWERGVPTPPFDILANAEADLGTYQGLDLIGANKINGVAKATSTVTAPNFTLPVTVPITIPETTKPAAPPLKFEGLTGQTPSLTFTQTGIVNITVDKLDLNIAAFRADGSAIILPPVVPVDSDGDPNTFDVPCVLKPSDQNKTLQNTNVVEPEPENTPPSKPGGLAGTATGETSVDLSWTASTDDKGVEGYDIYQDGVKVDTVTGTSASITGLTAGTTYAFKVQAFDEEGELSEFSDEVSVETDSTPVDNPPSAPTDLAGTPSTDSVELSWTASTDDNGVAGYDVFQDGVKVDSVTGTSATITGLTAATEYKFKVQAVDTAGQTSDFSTEISVTTTEVSGGEPPTTPGEPYITSFEDVTETSVHLYWDASTDPDGDLAGYEIRYEGQTVDVGNVTDFVLENLTPLGIYEIDVRAYDAAGNYSAYSTSIVLELPGPDEPPSKVENLTGTATGETTVDLSWDPATDDVFVAGYEVYQDGVKIAETGSSETTFSVTGLSEGTTYAFKVRALDAPALKPGPFSDEIQVTTQGTDAPPSAPANLAGTPSIDEVALSWDASTDDKGVAGYDVYQDGVKIDTVTGTSKTVTGLTAATAYQFKVQAVDTAGQTSDFSDEITVETLADNPPSAPTGLAGTPSATSVALAWSASTDDVGVAGYDVYVNGSKVDTVTGTSKTVTGLTPSTAYMFKVQAVDTAGQTSEFSEEIEVTTSADSTIGYSYDLAGSSQLKNLTRGTVPLSGGIDAELELSSGDYEADLTLNKTRARLKVLGLLPVTADVDFAQTDKTRGSLKSGVLTATAKFKIKLPKVYLFGVLPIVGSTNCETKSASIASMKSVGSFDPLTGGRLTGTYGISDLTGCGWLNNLLSPLTKGGGNTIDVNLTSKGPSAS